jgi:hypothetical protein
MTGAENRLKSSARLMSRYLGMSGVTRICCGKKRCRDVLSGTSVSNTTGNGSGEGIFTASRCIKCRGIRRANKGIEYPTHKTSLFSDVKKSLVPTAAKHRLCAASSHRNAIFSSLCPQKNYTACFFLGEQLFLSLNTLRNGGIYISASTTTNSCLSFPLSFPVEKKWVDSTHFVSGLSGARETLRGGVSSLATVLLLVGSC